MANPTLKVEIAFVSNPLDTAPTFVDVSADVRESPGVTVTRGGNGEPQASDSAGRASFTLSNLTRKYDPTNVAGPYYGNLKARKQVRVTATWSAVSYPVFYGFIDDGFTVSVTEGGTDSVVEITASDGLSYLAGARLSGDPLFDYATSAGTVDAFWRQADALSWIDSTGTHTSTLPSPLTLAASMCAGSTSPSVRFTGSSYLVASDYTTAIGDASALSFWLTCSPFTVETAIISANTLNFRELRITSAGLLRFYEGPAGVNQVDLSSVTRVDDGIPHHVVLTADGTTLKIYIDGTLNASASWLYPTVPGVVAGGSSIASPTAGGPYANPTGGYSLQDLLWVSSLDASEVLDIYNLSRGEYVETTAARVGRLLDAAGWPAAWRTIATDTRGVVSELVYNGQQALTGLQQVERSEQGRFFVGKDGKAVFLGRYTYAEVPRSSTVQVTLSDDGADIGYMNFRYGAGDGDVCNDMTVRNNLNTARSTNSASQTEYGAIADTTDTNLSSLSQVKDMAAGLVYQRKDAATRFDPVTVSPDSWAGVLGLELGDRIKVEGTPVGVGAQSAQEQLVESISWSMSDASGWFCTIAGSPVPANTFWVLGTSLLSTSTVPGF